MTVVGLADTEVKEARERVRAALQNSGLSFPANKRITVNLAPADLPKEGGRFDLPMTNLPGATRTRFMHGPSQSSTLWPIRAIKILR
jgi:predicted ATPase with chaperone activity